MTISYKAVFYVISTAFLHLFCIIFTSYLQVVDNYESALPCAGM